MTPGPRTRRLAQCAATHNLEGHDAETSGAHDGVRDDDDQLTVTFEPVDITSRHSPFARAEKGAIAKTSRVSTRIGDPVLPLLSSDWDTSLRMPLSPSAPG